MGTCCSSPANDASNTWPAVERRFIKPDYSSSEDDGRSFVNRSSSDDDQEEAKQYEHLDDETRAAYIGLLRFKRANGCPDLKFADLV
jgi:hypothetical protein